MRTNRLLFSSVKFISICQMIKMNYTLFSTCMTADLSKIIHFVRLQWNRGRMIEYGNKHKMRDLSSGGFG